MKIGKFFFFGFQLKYNMASHYKQYPVIPFQYTYYSPFDCLSFTIIPQTLNHRFHSIGFQA